MYFFKDLQELKLNFDGLEDIQRNYSQAFQDIFVLTMLNGKRGGSFLEIGAFDPIHISNTYLLEKSFGWSGLAIDFDPSVERKFKKARSSNYLTADALLVDYKEMFSNLGFGKQIDYLCLDIEPSEQTLACLKALPLDDYRFSTITYETDFYSPHLTKEKAISIRDESREILQSKGYILVGKGVACSSPLDVFEDWYVDPKIVPRERYERFITDNEYNDSGQRFLTKPPHYIATELWDGQGLGNQLWAYATTRSIALHRNLDFAILGKERFKGRNFIEIDFGKELKGGESVEGGPAAKLPVGLQHYISEDYQVFDNTSIDVSCLDSRIYNCPVNSKIDGNFQSFNYLQDYANEIKQEIKISILESTLNDNDCVIHVRGGDFKGIKSVALNKEYFARAMSAIISIHPTIKFKCVTDDLKYAKSILPEEVEFIGSCINGLRDDTQSSHHIGGDLEIDFKILISAKYLIIPNSSFSWWAAFLSPSKILVIAPKYWAAHNLDRGIWSTFEIATPGFHYLDKAGHLQDYSEVSEEIELTKIAIKKLFKITTPPWRLKKEKKYFRIIKKYLRLYIKNLFN
jgi:hypothetical protein